MAECLSAADRMFLITALSALQDKHPKLIDDPLWRWAIEFVAPLPENSARTQIDPDFSSECMQRCLALARQKLQ